MIEQTLKKLGLNAYEVAIYKTLVEYGKCNAKDISDISKVPITAVYPNLKSLINRGIIQEILGEVKYYLVKDIALALRTYSKKRIEEFNSLSEEAIKEVSSLGNKRQIVKEPETVEILSGGEASTQLILRDIKNTKKTLYIFGWRFSTTKNMFLILQGLKELIKKGKDVRLIISNRGKAFDKLIDSYSKSGIKIKYHQSSDFSIMIRDSESCILTAKGRELQDRIHVDIGNKDIAQAMHDYFLQVWGKAEDKIYF